MAVIGRIRDMARVIGEAAAHNALGNMRGVGEANDGLAFADIDFALLHGEADARQLLLDGALCREHA